MILCGCAIEAQYIKLQMEAKKQKSLSVGWQKFLEKQAAKNSEKENKSLNRRRIYDEYR